MRFYGFDLDGTLADTRHDLAVSVNTALGAVGVASLPMAEVLRHVGDGAPTLIRRCLGVECEDRHAACLDAFLAHYAEHLLDATHLYPGTRETLGRLEGRIAGVASNKPEAHCRRILEGLGVLECFPIVLGGDSLPSKKPDPMPLLHMAAQRGLRPAEGIYVGDSPGDVTAALAAGWRAVGVAWGFRAPDLLRAAGAERILESWDDLTAE